MKDDHYSYCTTSGGLITSHFLELLKGETTGFDYARPETFSEPWREEDPVDSKEFDRRVEKAWKDLRDRYDELFSEFATLDEKALMTKWIRPLFRNLGFELTHTSKKIEISDKIRFSFSHRGWYDKPGLPKAPVVHIVPYGTDLDVRPEPRHPGPHDALQDYLNLHDDLWAMVTNGQTIRILRDFHHTTVKGYIEFDLEGIFLTRSYPDFLALYRFCHASRFAPKDGTDTLYLEEYYEHSRQAGEKVGDRLRENVVHAIETFGNGFLDHKLLHILKDDDQKVQDYYEDILRVIYRIIFLLYAEQRGMLGGMGEAKGLFLDEYSITALRERCVLGAAPDDRHTDFWEGLKITFRMIEKGVPEMGIYPFNGMLFDLTKDRILPEHQCTNAALLQAIRYLTWTEPETGRGHHNHAKAGPQRISYADLSVEEIGAIYESLLDYTPRIITEPDIIEGRTYAANSFFLDPRGSDRKSTGSYYTNPSLVQELIKSALVPVIARKLREAGPTSGEKERALLSIKVCDPACGSGAFLIAASNKLGFELAKVRTGSSLPELDTMQEARRDVLTHCIYGVDLNPMAVELAKVSLWINALVRDKPLNFLDHHVRCGNSLIGATPELMAEGIPDVAFTPISGDVKTVATELKKANKEQRKNQTLAQWTYPASGGGVPAQEFAHLSEYGEDDPEAVGKKKTAYCDLVLSDTYLHELFVADLWTAAFFWPLTPDTAHTVPTTGDLSLVRQQGKDSMPADVQAQIHRLRKEHRFFHWHLEFPDVFSENNGGFDCILGNPPWEVVNLNEKEFFAYRDPVIAESPGAKRKKLIAELVKTNPKLHEEYIHALRHDQLSTKFIRNSGRFPLTARGKTNTYSIFTELARCRIAPLGMAGIIVPTGIATDATTAKFFGDLVDTRGLVSLYDFENRKKIFPIDSRMKFCLITMAGSDVQPASFDLAFFLHTFDDLENKERKFTLTPEEIALINPNTKNCPIFRSKRDAEITKAIYERVPVLIDETKGDTGNPWGVSFKQGLFNMTSDSHLFRTRKEMEDAGFVLEGNRFVKRDEVWLPLYEAKMFHQYDHRFGTFDGFSSRPMTQIHSLDENNYQNTKSLALSWYWVPALEVDRRFDSKTKWIIAFRSVARATDIRSGLFCHLPKVGVGHTAYLMLLDKKIEILQLYSNINSFAFDFNCRNKLGAINLGYFILKQLPVLPPTTYTTYLTTIIAPSVIELTYTAWDLKPFAEDVLAEIGVEQWNNWFPDNLIGPDGVPQPFVWDEERRFSLRCDLDALYFHLYGIPREDVDYIMETFPIVKRKDDAAYGTYRTKDVILERFDELEKEMVRYYDKEEGRFVVRMNADMDATLGPEAETDVVQGVPAFVFKGESECVEWKTSAFWSEIIPKEQLQKNNTPEVKQHNTRASHYIIAKAIAGFMNTKGGYLVIGLREAKDGISHEYCGIEGDYPKCPDKNPDGFIRALQEKILKKYFPNSVLLRSTEFLTYRIVEKDGAHLCVVVVRPYDEPVFIEAKGKEAFYVRLNGMTKEISKYSEIMGYCGKHFVGNKLDSCLNNTQ
ncbi:AlbA family DNA-binding domain-containing protein [Methanogenium organophilum]|uniref:site-specific DNA-methyltransferase (adenine-specific) n=1 Tax=Methanogenium organophilum TaxID=2199 RepID=A0A9X9T739_METOG|nr:RNA-binding domain-containing protein [Methanogenium organophilum]WAI00953.1 putative DNA binding domain-containing protein [Methanogenium organophilum]